MKATVALLGALAASAAIAAQDPSPPVPSAPPAPQAEPVQKPERPAPQRRRVTRYADARKCLDLEGNHAVARCAHPYWRASPAGV